MSIFNKGQELIWGSTHGTIYLVEIINVDHLKRYEIQIVGLLKTTVNANSYPYDLKLWLNHREAQGLRAFLILYNNIRFRISILITILNPSYRSCYFSHFYF